MIMEKNKPIQLKRPCVKKPLGALVAAAVMLSAAYFNPPSVSKVVCELNADTSSITQTVSLANPASQCSELLTPEVSWLEWAAGKSTSYQFHFFDLLELLYGRSDSNFNAPAGK